MIAYAAYRRVAFFFPPFFFTYQRISGSFPLLFFKKKEERMKERERRKGISFNSGNNSTLINSTCNIMISLGCWLLRRGRGRRFFLARRLLLSLREGFSLRVLLYSVSVCCVSVCVPPGASWPIRA